MEKREQEAMIAKQERVARQQELLEKKRRAKAEYNVSSGKGDSPLREERRQELLAQKQKREQVHQKKKREKVRKRFQSSYQSAVAFDDAEGVSVSQWFLSVCWLKIPVFGFIYALVMAFHPKVHPSKRNFARGYLVYRVLVLLLSITILYVFYKIGLDLIDQMLSFVR